MVLIRIQGPPIRNSDTKTHSVSTGKSGIEHISRC